MSFVVTEKFEEYEWEVHIKRPEKGRFIIQPVTITFHYRTSEELEARNDELKDVSNAERDLMMTDYLVKGWPDKSGLLDADGQPWPFSEENRQLLIRNERFQKAAILAFYDMKEGFLRKN